MPNEVTKKEHLRFARGKALDDFLSVELQRRHARHRIIRPMQTRRPKPRIRIVLLMLVLGGFLVFFSGARLVPAILGWTDCGAPAANRHAVALIDSLSSESPDQGFVRGISAAAENASYAFDYYPPASATVDLFTKLPDLGYSIIILRMHGTGVVRTDPSAIVTSNQYSSSQYVGDQLLDRVISVRVNGTQYLALTPAFISNNMCGRFSGTLVLAMFCESGQYSFLAKAFLERGAGNYIGWDNTVTVSHTDLTFQSLTTSLLAGAPVDQSVQRVMRTMGPDPLYGARLVSYSQSSFSLATTPLWEQYWYIVSAVVLVAIIGLGRARNSSVKRPRKTQG